MKRRVMLSVLLCVLVAGGGCGGGNWSSGDRVLVAKFLSDTRLARPERWDVVVFKFPRDPVQKGVPKNYIKRLLGLPGELLAILFGRIYVAQAPVDFDDSGAPQLDLWRAEYMNRGRDPKLLDLSLEAKAQPAATLIVSAAEPRFWATTAALGDRYVWNNWDTYKFKIQRKPLDTLMAMRRIVNDNDFQPKSQLEPRWAGAGGWAAPTKTEFRHAGAGQDLDWLRYRHLIRVPSGGQGLPQLITDFEGYNSYSTVQKDGAAGPRSYDPHNWVGDLMLEAKVKVESPKGQFVMELAKGVDRFQAVWDLASGDCTLYRITRGKDGKDGSPQQLAKQPATDLKAAGDYDLRFANVDARLTVWINGRLQFGDGHEYAEAEDRGPGENDLKPASVGSRGAAVSVKHLKLWRDTYYTLRHDAASDAHIGAGEWSDPAKWGPLRQLPARLMYVPKGHHLCMGDNSPQSSDSREWGTVPERLMLGRALLVYYPFSRAGRIK